MVTQVVGRFQLESHGREPFPIWGTNVRKRNSLEGHPNEIQQGQFRTSETSIYKGLHEVAVIGPKQRRGRKVFNQTHRVQREELPHMLIPAGSDIGSKRMVGCNTKMKGNTQFKPESFCIPQ